MEGLYIRCKEEIFHSKDGDAQEWVAQGSSGCPSLPVFSRLVQWVFEQPGLMEGVPACGRRVGTR